MQINNLFCIIHKLVKVVYENTAYEDTVHKSLFICISYFSIVS